MSPANIGYLRELRVLTLLYASFRHKPPDRAASDEPRDKSKVSVGAAALKCGVLDCFR